MKRASLIHFREKCIGCGSCADIAPEHWKMSINDGKASLQNARRNPQTFVKEVLEFDFASNQQAADACPVTIIQLDIKKK